MSMSIYTCDIEWSSFVSLYCFVTIYSFDYDKQIEQFGAICYINSRINDSLGYHLVAIQEKKVYVRVYSLLCVGLVIPINLCKAIFYGNTGIILILCLFVF